MTRHEGYLIHLRDKDPSTPDWARQTIARALQADPVDAANVLEVLAEAFGKRAQEIAERSGAR